MKKHLFNNPFFYSFFFTLFSLITHRYSYGIGDQAIHIPLIQKIVDTHLYSNDLLFTAGQGDLSLSYFFIGYIIKSFNLPIEGIFFVGYIITCFLLYFVLFLIGKYYFTEKCSSIILLSIFFLIPIQIGGTATYTIEASFVPRFVALVLSLYALYFTIIRKYFFVFLILSLIFAIHPISFLYISLIILLLIILISKHYPSILSLFIFTIFFIVLNFSLVSNILNKLSLNNIIINNQQKWVEILRVRNFYVFLDQWNYKSWINLILIALPSIYYIFISKKLNENLHKHIKIILYLSIFTTFINFIFTSILPLPFVAQLQLSRIWFFDYVGSILAIVSILSNLKINLNKISLIIIIVILVGSFYFHKKWYYTQNKYWINVQKWISENTDNNCLILTPFRHQGFRVYAKRSIVTEYKDGTLSFYSQDFANKWMRRAQDIELWENLDVDSLAKLQSKYFFSYLVALNDKNIPLKPIYNDGYYSVYQMPTTQKECILKNI